MTVEKRKKIKIGIFAAAVAGWLTFIFTNSLKSRADSAHQSAPAEGLLRRILVFFGFTGDAGRVAAIVVRKTAHVFEFFVLFLLLTLIFRAFIKSVKLRVAVCFVVSAACACIDESLQIVSERGASVKDVFIDCIGIACAACLYLLFLRSRRGKGGGTAAPHPVTPKIGAEREKTIK